MNLDLAFSSALVKPSISSTRFVATLSDHRSINPQLLGATCLHVASKCEDVTYIGIRDLAQQAVDSQMFQGRDILDLEERVLNALSFDLYFLSFFHFPLLLPKPKPAL